MKNVAQIKALEVAIKSVRTDIQWKTDEVVNDRETLKNLEALKAELEELGAVKSTIIDSPQSK